MARVENACSLVMFYETKFTSVIRGHHGYKARWTPVIGEKLLCKNDKREEAKAYDDFAVGLYKDGKDSSSCSDVLVGHVPIELSHLVCTFLNAQDSNESDAEVIGKRTLENGLVVPAIYSLRTRNKNISDVLNRELQAIKEKMKYKNVVIEKTVKKKKTGAFVVTEILNKSLFVTQDANF